MTINQLSVFIENKRGRLAEITNVLKQNNVDIRALSIADTKEFGILRLIVSDAGKAAEVLRADGFTVALTHPPGYVLSEARSCRSAFSLFPAANSLLHNFSDFHLTEIFLHRQAVKELFSSPDLTPLQELLRFLQDTSYDNLSEDTIFHPVHLP